MKFQEKKLEVSHHSVVILRVLLSFIFIVASLSHLFNTEKTVSRIQNQGSDWINSLLSYPEFAVILSGIVMLFCGISLLFGYRTKIVSTVLIAILTPITITIQLGGTATIGPLFKNVAILGGLLFFSINSNLKFSKK